MQRVGDFVSGVGGNPALADQFEHVHAPHGGKQLLAGEPVVQPLVHETVYQQGDETGQEVALYAVLAAEVDGTGPELRLHDAEAFLDLPAATVDRDDV